jgi:hypothetical protein
VTSGDVNETYTEPKAVAEAREVHASAMQELPLQAHRLQRGEAAIPTEFI